MDEAVVCKSGHPMRFLHTFDWKDGKVRWYACTKPGCLWNLDAHESGGLDWYEQDWQQTNRTLGDVYVKSDL